MARSSGEVAIHGYALDAPQHALAEDGAGAQHESEWCGLVKSAPGSKVIDPHVNVKWFQTDALRLFLAWQSAEAQIRSLARRRDCIAPDARRSSSQ